MGLDCSLCIISQLDDIILKSDTLQGNLVCMCVDTEYWKLEKGEDVCMCVLPRVKDAAKQDNGSHSGDNLLVALRPRVEGKHTHGCVHTISLHH